MRQIRYQDPPVAVHTFENGTPAFFVQHGIQGMSSSDLPFCLLFPFITFSFVCPRQIAAASVRAKRRTLQNIRPEAKPHFLLDFGPIRN